MKTKLIALSVAAVMSVAGLTACTDDSKSPAEGVTATESAVMDQQAYMDRLEALNTAGQAYMDAGVRLLNAMNTEQIKDKELMKKMVDELRATKEPFLAFADIRNAPAMFEKEQAELARSTSEVGECIEEQAAMLGEAVAGKLDEKALDEKTAAIEKRLTPALQTIGDLMGRMRATAAQPAPDAVAPAPAQEAAPAPAPEAAPAPAEPAPAEPAPAPKP